MELLALLIPADFLQKSKTKILEKVWSKWTQTSTFRNTPDSKIRQTISPAGGKEKFLELLKNKSTIQNLSSKKALQKWQIQSAPSEKLEPEETFPIHNSGLVLAVPFLPYFF
ncbi:contractile injection system tape measure protein [Algoriphagus boritolerans]|uniref:contractile injection system tape measure protein n=1 Tax=Algoriphagus boritolerans TaxID=308111 RepID=UPI003A0FC2F3